MARRNILIDGDPALLKKSRVVTDFNKRLFELLDHMRETLTAANGVGLAAPQVGVLRRVVLVVDTNKEDLPYDEQIIELINPEIAASSGEQSGLEGCLSVPGVYGIVKRPDFVKVKAQDRFGEPFEVFGSDLTARAFCHEINHLDGIIFTTLAEKILTPEELAELDRQQAEDDEEWEKWDEEGSDE